MENSITYLMRNYHTISNDNYKIFYDFNTSGKSVENITGELSLSGYITGNNISNFYIKSGLANFSGNSVYVDNSSGDINVKNCTYFLTYENMALGDFSLINCIETGVYNGFTYNKGYEFGVTANNYLYFNYYNSSGPQVFIAKESMSDKSNVFLSVDSNTIRFGSYNFVSQTLNLNSYPIDSKYIFDPSGIWISSNLKYTDLYNRNKPLNGTMERVLILSPSVALSDIRLMNSGTVSDYYSGGNIVTYTSGIDITGYSTGVLPYFTGVTGTSYEATGVITDIFGDTYSGYGQVDLTGVLYNEQILPQYGIIYIPNTGYVKDYSVINNNLINTYGKSSVNFLFDISTEENVNIVYNTGNDQVLRINNLPSVKANGFNYFTWVNSNKSSYQVWCDGLYQYSGKNVLSGDIYNTTNIISGDYVIDENSNMLFSNSFGIRDNVKVDVINPVFYNNLYIDNFTLQYSDIIVSGDRYYLNLPYNSQIFLNGQKLISGSDSEIGVVADYGIDMGMVYFKNSGIFYDLPSSVLSAIVESGICDDISQSNLMTAKSAFLINSVKAYRNGIRLDNGYDYLELGCFDSNLGTGIFDKKSNIIYNGNGGFN